MSKLNSITIRTWGITMFIIGFCFITTNEIYGRIYQNNIEKNYLTDYEQSIESIEGYLEKEPHFLIENLDKLKAHDTHLFMEVYLDGQLVTDSYTGTDPSVPTTKKKLLANEDVTQAVNMGRDTQIISKTKIGSNQNTLFMFRIKNFTLDGKKGALYSFVDLASLNETEKKMNQWTLINFIFYGILSVLFFYYLQKRLGKPLNTLRDIAFEYAKNDFSQEAPINFKDELSQLALAMNKMRKSLETTGTATRQEKELLENIVSSISTGILYYNQDKTLLMSNPLGENFLRNWNNGEGTEEQSLPDFLADKIDEVINKSEKVYHDTMINDFYFQISLVPLFDEDLENVRGVLVSLQDLTKERRLDKMRVDFINNVSHELRTPLVMIQGYSEAILDDVAETDEEKHEMASIIGDESKRMNRLVNEMLDLSRMEAGYIDLVPVEVDLEAFFMKILSRFNRMAEKNQVHLSLEIEPSVKKYYMDEDKMNQVFVNLINNAIRHASLSERNDAHVKLWVHEDKITDEVQMEVIDNGPGIAEVDIPYIFDRFYKADKSRTVSKSSQTGTGIGLSIVKNIVEEHGGYIEVISVPNKVTSFRIHFPYIEELDEAD